MDPIRQPDPALEREQWRKIESIYVAALSRPPAERAQFVEEACQGDQSMKRILDSLVEHADDAKGFMEAPAIELAAQIASEGITRPPEIRRLGAYDLGVLIGAGGMGEVYRGRDTRLGRDVAIKLLPASMGHDPHRLQRFEREARLLASLNHPNIASIYEFEEAEGVHGLVMELVEGPTLSARIAEGPLPLAQALPIAAQVADAVHAAHLKGIIHRDLKPANIKASPGGLVKVLDFGLAKVWADSAAAPPLTIGSTGDHIVLLGTPAYMSPEQAQGKPVDTRTDVWAFGCVVYEMLTGVSAFAGNSPWDTIAHVLERQPDWQLLPPATPDAIRDLLVQCLDKNAESRLSDLATARFVIQRCINDYDAAPDSRSDRSAKRSGQPGRSMRFQRKAVAAAIFGAVLVGLLAVRTFPILPHLSQPALAFKERDWVLIADFENLTGDDVFNRSLRAALEVSIAQSQFVWVFPTGRVQAALRRMQAPAPDPLTESLAAEVAVREGIKGVLAGTIAQIGDTYSLTARVIDPQTRVAVRTASRQANGKNQVLSALGELAIELRRNLGESLSTGSSSRGIPLPQATTFSLEALKMYADSFKLASPNSPDDGHRLLRGAISLDQNFALAHAELGRRYYLSSESAVRRLGEEHFVKALALLDRLSPRERLWIPAIAEDARGNRSAAVDAYKTYLAQYPDDARAWFRLGWTEMAGLGHYDTAAPSFARALALNPSDTAARVNLASSYSGAGKYREAVDEYRRSFATEPALITAEFVNHEFGFTLVRLGELDAAADVFRKMTADRQPGKQARGYRSLALLSMYKGDYTSGIADLRKAVSINHSIGAGVSEFADRLFLVRALDAKSMQAEVKTELSTLDALAARLSLAPGWLSMLAKIHARKGHLPRARALLSTMTGASGDATADSYANLDREREKANIDLTRGEVAVAEGKAKEAAERLESASLVSPHDGHIIESLAAALTAAGRLEDAARRYEQLIALLPLGTHAQEQWLEAHVRLGAIYQQLGRPDAARQMYEQLLKILNAADKGLVLTNDARSRLAALSVR